MSQVEYIRPESAAEACAALVEVPVSGAVLAGGTDLSVRLRGSAQKPARIVDIKGIPGIEEIEWTSDGDLILGAGVVMHEIAESAEIHERFPALAQGAEQVGSLQIRQRATIGGNLCNASPCMDTAPGLMIYGAILRVMGPKGEREIPIGAFFTGVGKTALEEAEILLSIRVPNPPKELVSAFGKVTRVKGHDLALVNLAVGVDKDKARVRACAGSCAVKPVLVVLEEVNLEEINALGEALDKAMNAAISPIDDVRATAEYRHDMTGMLSRRLIRQLLTTA